MSEGSLQKGAQEYQNLGQAFVQAGKSVMSAAGSDLFDNSSRTGKGVLITWWVLIVAIFIYMIVLAIIYYNEYTKYKWNKEDKVWQYCTTDNNNKQTCEIYEGLTEDDIVTWNIHKTVMNGLLAFMNIFGICIVLFGVGSIEKPARDVCGSDQLGWLCVLNVIWFIINMVWDIKFSQYTKTSQADATNTEKFCGMMETFCGSVSEGFANVNKKLRKF